MKVSYKTLTFKIAGVSPLLLHNGQLADPLNQWSKMLKKVSGKRAKTEADYEEMSRLEWYGSLYTEKGAVCLPGYVIEASLASAARKSKRGKQAQAGIICPDNYPLHFDGEAAIDALWAGGKHILKVLVRVGPVRIVRTRPKFDNWWSEIGVMYDPQQLNETDILDILKTCGESNGLCDWRPKFGRFEVAGV